MKQIIYSMITILTVLLFSLSGTSQVCTDWGIGYDFTQSVGIGSIGYELNGIVIDANISPSFGRQVQPNNFMSIRAGYDLYDIIVPQIGYYYNCRSNDNKNLNYNSIGYPLEAMFPATRIIDNNSRFYIIGIYVQEQSQFQVITGFHAVID